MGIFKRVTDYTKQPVGKMTRDGQITTCIKCGKLGAYHVFSVLDKQFEQWTHHKELIWPIIGSYQSCSHQIAGPPFNRQELFDLLDRENIDYPYKKYGSTSS